MSHRGAELAEPVERLNVLSGIVVDAAVEVHRVLGPGFVESVYEEALAVELNRRRLPFARQVPVDVVYKGHQIGHGRVDLLVGGELVVELKTAEALTAVHLAQMISYLRAFHSTLGLLITFNVPQLRQGIRRVILSARPPSNPAAFAPLR